MTKHATATLNHTSWAEQPFAESEQGPKLTRASVAFAYRGEIEGESALEYLMIYLRDDYVPYVGVERVVGRLGDRTGSFVLRHEGAFANHAARATLTVVEESGTGDLHGLTGTGNFTWAEGEGESGSLTLDYDIG